MNEHDLVDPASDKRQWLHRAGLVAWGLLLLASSIVGVWYSQRPPENAPQVDISLVALAQHALSGRQVANVEFEDGQGRKRTLADFRGKVVLLNLWATWCDPCRKEMPTLDRLQQRLGSADFEVVALSIDRGGQAAVKSFFEEIDIRALAIYVDATAEAGNKLGIVGIPTTLLLDREGREVARYAGPAKWDSTEVVNAITHYLPPPHP